MREVVDVNLAKVLFIGQESNSNRFHPEYHSCKSDQTYHSINKEMI